MNAINAWLATGHNRAIAYAIGLLLTSAYAVWSIR